MGKLNHQGLGSTSAMACSRQLAISAFANTPSSCSNMERLIEVICVRLKREAWTRMRTLQTHLAFHTHTLILERTSKAKSTLTRRGVSSDLGLHQPTISLHKLHSPK